MQVGNNIKKIRELHNLTQEYMAGRLGISQAAYSKIENNELKMNQEKLQKIAEVLGTDIETIKNFDATFIFNNHSNHNSNIYNVFSSERKHYERQIELLEKHISSLEAHIQTLQTEISFLRNTSNSII